MVPQTIIKRCVQLHNLQIWDVKTDEKESVTMLKQCKSY